MTNDTKQYCSGNPICSRAEGHFGSCEVNDRAQTALDASRRLRHQQVNEIAATNIVLLGMLGDAQQVLGDLVAISSKLQMYQSEASDADGMKGIEAIRAARTLLDTQKEASR